MPRRESVLHNACDDEMNNRYLGMEYEVQVVSCARDVAVQDYGEDYNQSPVSEAVGVELGAAIASFTRESGCFVFRR